MYEGKRENYAMQDGVGVNKRDKTSRFVELLRLLELLLSDGDLLLVQLVIGTGLLVLHVLGNEILQVGLGLGLHVSAIYAALNTRRTHEFELVHTLSSVPVDVSLSPVHRRELVSNTLEEGLDRGTVADESRRHFETTRRNVTLSGRNVSWDPLDEVARVLGLDSLELVLDFSHGDLSSEDTAHSEVSTVTGVGGGHHVLGVEHLLSKLRNGDSAVRSRSTGGKGSETDHEEVETRERNHVDTELSQVRVELTGETETSGDTGHDDGNEVVKITVGGSGELESSEANVVKSLVVDTESSVRVLNELVDGEGGVVRLNDGVGDLTVNSSFAECVP